MSKLILSADDSASIRHIVSFTLTQAGFSVIEACDGEEAFAKMSAQQVSMLITDLNMPGMSGIELIKRVRALPQYRFTPIVMLTTESHVDKRAAGKAAGASGWVVKPFTEDQLLKVVNLLLV